MVKKSSDQKMVWKHLFSSNRKLRFFPPHFWLRNPVISILKKVRKNTHPIAVVVFEVESFKHQIDQYGSEYIQEFKTDMRNLFKEAVCRSIDDHQILFLQQYWGDDVVLLVSLECENDVIGDIERYIATIHSHIMQQILVPTRDGGNEKYFQAGYMVLDTDESEELLQSFQDTYQKALAMAKKSGQTNYNQMVHEISSIIRNEQISLFSQPIINVEDRSVSAWEVLTRGPENSPYEHPLQLFSMARQTNQLYPLELIVIKKALDRMEGEESIFINITPLTVSHERFPNDVDRILSEAPSVDPSQLVFEITERESVHHYPQLKANLKALRKKGMRIALDDAGAGFANLNSISFVLPDIIKIDRSLISNINGNKLKESMLQGLLHIAKEADALVVAEGIETAAEAFVMERNGVHMVQGFFYARPRLIPTTV
ncbi:EAL domain-containing protein [Alkalihalobacillus sp. AL-G]|uniref:EAL domain-containing protein n=1 Tax=Alkalihalobacillus sp. AL-G TaxID=2926399 RepID=UPI00272C8EFA|nr:EAL domain-containing protein [Alkalihalobacillus sp. AL-G]WLD92691.1 EAL domain-containing protein [Alkalihalobacillus sp. AL-G]